MMRWRHVQSVLWALGLALIVEALAELPWWHPYCDSQADGPGYFAYGFPLPYREFSDISSLEYVVMPHVFALNIALLVLVAWPVTSRLAAWLATTRPVSRRLCQSVGAIVALAAIALTALTIALSWIPVASIGSVYDRYVDYRPAFLTTGPGHRLCEVYR